MKREKKEKVMNFIKKHKVDIFTTAAIVAGELVIFAVIKRKAKVRPNKNIDLPCPKLDVGSLDYLWLEQGEWVTAIISDLKLSDLGNLGKELLKIDKIKPDTVVQMVIEEARY